ncbi:acyltransferase [Fulvivirgaceae bacterium BMA10]|uniref:Acyltransferase n=1 Tax=Splendidivirga corallicola TaxID=3051826 RepID=A0ABT8KPW9_9BACT|nr:acyltransferase [Fulvivirgaceae bacterium BMA10]
MSNKLKYLEGLRGLAAIVVMLRHLQLAFAENTLIDLKLFLENSYDSWLVSHVIHASINLFFNGELAVFIFWFLSAYVISIKLFTTNDNSYLTQAFSKRYIRLAIPVLASVLVAYCLILSGLMFNRELAFNEAGNINEWLAEYYDFTPNMVSAIKIGLWDTFFGSSGEDYNPVLWTMNPELYGSLFCFIIYSIFSHNKFRFYFYFAIAIGAFILTKYWLVTFILGHILCDAQFSKTHGSAYKAFLFFFKNERLNVFYFLCLLILGGFYNYFSFYYIPISALLVITILQTKKIQTFFESNYLVWLGKISFSLYLIHFPIICSFSCFIYLNLPFDRLGKTLIVVVLTIAVSLICAHFFTKYIDNFSKLSANKFGRLVGRNNHNTH